MLNPRAIATLGVGYGPAALARLGMWPTGLPSPRSVMAGADGQARRGHAGEAHAAMARHTGMMAAIRRDDDEVLSLLSLFLGKIL